MASPEKEALAFVASVKATLKMPPNASDADALKEIADLMEIADASASPAPGERKVLAVIAKGAAPFRRGGLVIPHDRPLILDESTMDRASVEAINEERNIIKLRSGDPFTPESEIERTTKS